MSEKPKTKPSVYVAYTGGTIGMVSGQQGFHPKEGFLAEQLEIIRNEYADELPEIEVHSYEPLLDSANMSPVEWLKIAQDIESRYDEFDGFVILHGTDTMAYTASALSFMLEELSKPVVITGSQIPLGQIRSDAKDNIIGALLIAGYHQVPEVSLYFHNHLYRGNRSSKVDATGFDAFASPNFPPLAEVGTKIRVNHRIVREFPKNSFRIQSITPPKIVTMHLFPGFDASLIRALAEQSIDGIILRTYGVGNAPARDKDLIQALEDAHNQGVVIVNCTQCHQGMVDMNGYETGAALLKAGVVSGSDMTAEAALTKLYYLFSAGLTQQQIEQQIQLNLRGELSEA
ncbi:MAG: asparaginase [Methylococcales bacterium]